MADINNKLYRELRCKACRKLICFEYIFAGRIAFQCPRCSELNEHIFKHLQTQNVTDTMNKEFGMNSKESEVK